MVWTPVEVLSHRLQTSYTGEHMNESTVKWDNRFLKLSLEVASWSKDPSTKSGAVIVRPDKTIVSVGYNGFPRKMSDADKLYADREKKYSRVVHCEVNALIAAREQVTGCTLYTNWMCCDRCVVQMIQAGITRFVFYEATPEQLERWGEAFKLTASYMDEAGCERTEYPREEEDGHD